MAGIATYFLELLQDPVPSIVILACVVCVFILFAENNQQVRARITNGRNRWCFAYLVASIAVILIFILKKSLPIGWLLTSSIVFLAYAFLCVLSLKPKTERITNPLLRYYKKRLNEGDVIRYKDFFKKEKRIFLFDSDEQIEYQLLRSSWFASLGEWDKSYKILSGIDDNLLYIEEREAVNLRRGYALTQMGAMKEASVILGNPEDNRSTDPFVWIAYSFICENNVDIDKAIEFAEKAKNYAETNKRIPEWEIGQVYNDYARVLLMKGDNEQALRYFGLAFQKMEHTDDIRIYSCVAGNYFNRCAIMGAPREQCEKLLEQYRNRVKTESIDNLIAFNNCEIAVYRQYGEEKHVYDLIKNEYWRIKEKTSGTLTEVFKASTFGLLINGSYVHDWFDSEISCNWSSFNNLEVIDRLCVFRTYSMILSQKENRHLLRLEPYKKLFELIMEYYHKDAINDVDTLLNQVDSYNIYKYKYLMEIKLDILKLIERGNHIANSGEMYKQLSKQLYDAQLRIDGTRALMNLINECESPNNIQIVIPTFLPLLYCDYIDNFFPFIQEPKVINDKIHTERLMYTLPPNAMAEPLQRKTIEENVETVSREIDNWNFHPAKVEFSVEIAHTYMALEKPEKAKKYYEYYLSTHIAPTALPIWYRETIAELEKSFGYN